MHLVFLHLVHDVHAERRRFLHGIVTMWFLTDCANWVLGGVEWRIYRHCFGYSFPEDFSCITIIVVYIYSFNASFYERKCIKFFFFGGEESCIKYYSNIVIYMLCLYYYYDYCIRCAGHVVYYYEVLVILFDLSSS